MTFKFGLEQEFFLLDGEGKPMVIPQGFRDSMDESGILLEVRGKPYESITDAVHSLMSEKAKLEYRLRNTGWSLGIVDFMAISKETRMALRRQFTKGVVTYQNLYSHQSHKNPKDSITAGIHLSVTNLTRKHYSGTTSKGDNYSGSLDVNAIWDYSRLFRLMDKHFAPFIKQAKRNPGFYEIKSDGRIEYRSLPTTIPMENIYLGMTQILKQFN